MAPAEITSTGQEVHWVRAAQSGDPEAFRRLVDAYDRRLLYFVLRLLPDADRALDLLQDVWLIVLRRLPTLRAPQAFRCWLYQIAHDQVVSQVRRDRREERAVEELRHHSAEADEGPEPAFERADLVHQALQRLSPEHREVLLLRFLEGMTLEEIAEALRCSLGTVKSRLHYARQALRQHVEKLSNE
ncbi:MAG: sigma-70 family RNA polymerase sigma factor [Gemmataceae bacterium]|nr:sigma-70 family RNA polymerase sigma factor [Gemmataceae bacterium]